MAIAIYNRGTEWINPSATTNADSAKLQLSLVWEQSLLTGQNTSRERVTLALHYRAVFTEMQKPHSSEEFESAALVAPRVEESNQILEDLKQLATL